MSKAVHWQVPFCSLKGVQYRVDIYDDDYTGSPVQLTGGATPFVTDEDNDDNFFAPVRTQTGQLTVIDMDGTLMETLIPSDNTARPVRLIRVSDSTVMWQGFLSCEAYSQDYTSRAQELTLNVNSVLAAMESVKVTESFSGMMTIINVLKNMFAKMNSTAGIDGMINTFYLPYLSHSIVDKYIDASSLFEEHEKDDENGTIFETVGISIKDALERICTFMGWVCEENGVSLIISDEGNSLYMYTYVDSRLIYNKATNAVSKTLVSMGSCEWRGTGHNIEFRQGAKSVEVVAKMQNIDTSMELPPASYESTSRYKKPLDDNDWKSIIYSIANNGTKSWNRASYRNIKLSTSMTVQTVDNGSTYYASNFSVNYVGTESSFALSNTLIGAGYHNTFAQAYRNCPFYSDVKSKPLSIDRLLFATPVLYEIYSDNAEQIHNLTKGVYMSCFSQNEQPITLYDHMAADKIIFSVKSKGKVPYAKCALNIEMNAEAFSPAGTVYDKPIFGLYGYLKIGDKYYNSNGTWTTSFHCESFNFDEGKVSLKTDKLPYGMIIPEGVYGDVEIGFTGITRKLPESNIKVYDVILSNLSMDVTDEEEWSKNDSSENVYYKELTKDFGDEISIETDFASDKNNRLSVNRITDRNSTPMTTLTYSDGTSERPEKHLLNRLAAYYGAVRRKITLEIDRPSNPLPLTKITGYDNRTYLPLAESRDWRMDKSTVTMYETT